MCRQFEPDRGSQIKTNLVLVFFAVLVDFGENCFSSENGTFSLYLYGTSSDRGSQVTRWMNVQRAFAFYVIDLFAVRGGDLSAVFAFQRVHGILIWLQWHKKSA